MKPILPFGKYVLLERISVGGMAEVFKARPADDEAAKLIAIKRILPSMSEDADFITMFIDEARISGQLNHPHIAQIYELSRVGESHFIAMEYVWGKDVLQMQNRFRRLKSVMPFPMAAFIASKMCDALDYAHRKKGPDGNPLGIIHRDVSPQNVLVSYQGEVKVIDFGIAKAASRSTKTQAGVLKGKFGYMSPEQVGGLPLDRRSDVFAIGTILYEMITADRLFIAESDFATLEKVRNVDVRPPSEAVPSCPPELDRIIRKALSKSVEERYQWAEEMAADLTAWLASLPSSCGERELSAWMQEHFSVELKREAQALEEQQQAAIAHARGVSAVSLPVAVALPMMAAAGGASLPAVVPHGTLELNADAIVSSEAVASAGNDLSSESTQIMNPEVHSSAVPLSAQSTLIADGGQLQAAVLAGLSANGPMGELSGESTRILSGADALPSLSRPMEEMPSQATAILDSSLLKLPPMILPTPPPLYIAPVPQPMGPMATGQQRGPGPGQLAFHPPTTRVEAPLPYAKRRSTWRSDVLIGFAVAAVIVGGALGFRYWKQGPRGTLVVAVSPPAAAHIFVDGVERGTVELGKAMTLRDLPAGAHRLEVRATSGSYADNIDVAASDISAVTAVLVAPPEARPADRVAAPPVSPEKPDTTAGIEKPAGEKPAERPPAERPAERPAGERPAEKPAGEPPAERPTAEEPVVEKPVVVASANAGVEERPAVEKPPVEKPVAVTTPQKPSMPTVSGKGHLQIKTDPPGADVAINGKPAGVTPLELGDVEPSRQVRITIRKKGYATIAKYLDFEKESDRVLDLTLLSMKGGKPESAEGSPEATAPPAARPAEKPVVAAVKPAEKPVVAALKPAEKPVVAALKPAEKPVVAAVKPAAPVARPVAPAEKPGAPAPDKGARPAATPPAAAPASNEMGFLVANTQPWAKVLIDGRDTGKSTPIAQLSKLPLKPGKHTVTFVVDGKKYSYPIEVKPGEILRVIKTLGGDAPAAP